MATLTDPRTDAWTRRRIERDRLALFRIYLASCCCCTRCGDDDKAEELRSLIAKALSA